MKQKIILITYVKDWSLASIAGKEQMLQCMIEKLEAKGLEQHYFKHDKLSGETRVGFDDGSRILVIPINNFKHQTFTEAYVDENLLNKLKSNDFNKVMKELDGGRILESEVYDSVNRFDAYRLFSTKKVYKQNFQIKVYPFHEYKKQ